MRTRFVVTGIFTRAVVGISLFRVDSKRFRSWRVVSLTILTGYDMEHCRIASTFGAVSFNKSPRNIAITIRETGIAVWIIDSTV